jgi:hypothetical protein
MMDRDDGRRTMHRDGTAPETSPVERARGDGGGAAQRATPRRAVQQRAARRPRWWDGRGSSSSMARPEAHGPCGPHALGRPCGMQ